MTSAPDDAYERVVSLVAERVFDEGWERDLSFRMVRAVFDATCEVLGVSTTESMREGQ